MEKNIMDQPSKDSFRSYLPDPKTSKWGYLDSYDAHNWADEFYKNEFAKKQTQIWKEKFEEPFYGMTVDGHITPSLYSYADYGVAIDDIVSSATKLIQLCDPAQASALKFPINSKCWKSWSNPEIYIFKNGLRLEEVPLNVSNAMLDVMKATLSPEGYKKAIDAMETNAFLGELVGGPGILNSRSYNFLLFGEPSTSQPWGWSLYGHHLCMNVYLDRKFMSVAPVFIGAEPNAIDDGPRKGLAMLRKEETLGLALMQNLPAAVQQKAQVYKNMHDESMPEDRWDPADQRHLCGAFQDNRQVPYEGVKVSEMPAEHIDKVFAILDEFLLYYPQLAREKRLEHIRKYLEETWFSWIGGFGTDDPFYYRIQNPVVVVEFDHHSGVFLENQEPAKFHIHTIARAPNGGDYGNALRKLEDRLN